MASPQTENGYTKIANELLAALAKTNLRGSEFMICLSVICKTYGWHKIDEKISLNDFHKMTGMDRRSCARSIKRLVARKVLGSDKGDTSCSSTYWIQKDYEKWIPSVKFDTSGTAVTRTSGTAVTRTSGTAVTRTSGTGGTPINTTIQPKETIKESIAVIKKLTAPTALVQKFFYDEYLKVFNETYVPNWGKEGSIFKDILKTIPEDRLQLLIKSFFQSNDEFIRNAGYTVGVFKSQINKLKLPGGSSKGLLELQEMIDAK